MAFVVGENVGPYRIIEKLGRGGMATVFNAYHPALDRYVAIKALHPAFMEDPNFLARFQREARVVAKLEHPNIVPIYDFAEHEGRPYLVMKFIEGETLKARLVRAGVLQNQVIKIVEAVGAGLTYAHARGILHRDVKPSNVLLANDGRIYLADFGLARIAQAGESTLSGDMMLGTPQYISPEQAMGNSDLNEGTDIYSYGVMLYELIVGQVPFSADTPFSIIHDHIYTPLPLPRDVNPNVPIAIERVLLKALAKEREDRFDDIPALVNAFTQAFSEADPDLVVSARSASESEVIIPPTIGEEAATLRAQEKDIPTESIPELVEAPVMPADAEPVEKKKSFLKRLRGWQIILASIVLVFCCLMTLAVIDNRRKQQVASTATQIISVVDEIPTRTPQKVEGNDQISLAKQKVDANPDDPQAHFELGMAYFDTGQSRLGEQAFKMALELSESSLDFYLKITEILIEDELWFNATQVYLDMFRNHPDQIGGGEMDNFHKSAFITSSFPEAAEAIPISDIAEVDDVFEQILKARNLLFNDSVERAQRILDEIGERGISYPEAQLVQAEIYNVQGKTRDAAEILEVLLKSDETPIWMKELIDEAIYTYQQRDGKTDTSMSVAEAQAVVDMNPDDPWAQLDLVDALLAAGEFDQVEAELQRALEISGDDPAVYLRAGNLLSKHNVNLYAVDMYVSAAYLPGDPTYEEVSGLIAEAMYLSSAGADAIVYLETLEADLDPMMMDIARVRNTLHNDDREVAQFQLMELKENYPDVPEVMLLESEILSILGEDESASELWVALIEDDTVPFWVRRQARFLVNKFDH